MPRPSHPQHALQKSATQHAVETICRMLRTGEYRIGDRVPSEPELGQALNVGRSAVREAVRELIALDLLEIRSGQGTFVKSLRPDLLFGSDSLGDSLNDENRDELLELRQIVEPEAAALAAERASAGDLARLERDVEALARAVARSVRPAEDLGFHLDVLRAASNASLARVSRAIISFYAQDGSAPTEADVVEHRRVFLAIRGRDAAAARQAMLAHLRSPPLAGPVS